MPRLKAARKRTRKEDNEDENYKPSTRSASLRGQEPIVEGSVDDHSLHESLMDRLKRKMSLPRQSASETLQLSNLSSLNPKFESTRLSLAMVDKPFSPDGSRLFQSPEIMRRKSKRVSAAARKSSIPVIPENETSDLSTANRKSDADVKSKETSSPINSQNKLTQQKDKSNVSRYEGVKSGEVAVQTRRATRLATKKNATRGQPSEGINTATTTTKDDDSETETTYTRERKGHHPSGGLQEVPESSESEESSGVNRVDPRHTSEDEGSEKENDQLVDDGEHAGRKGVRKNRGQTANIIQAKESEAESENDDAQQDSSSSENIPNSQESVSHQSETRNTTIGRNQKDKAVGKQRTPAKGQLVESVELSRERDCVSPKVSPTNKHTLTESPEEDSDDGIPQTALQINHDMKRSQISQESPGSAKQRQSSSESEIESARTSMSTENIKDGASAKKGTVSVIDNEKSSPSGSKGPKLIKRLGSDALKPKLTSRRKGQSRTLHKEISQEASDTDPHDDSGDEEEDDKGLKQARNRTNRNSRQVLQSEDNEEEDNSHSVQAKQKHKSKGKQALIENEDTDQSLSIRKGIKLRKATKVITSDTEDEDDNASNVINNQLSEKTKGLPSVDKNKYHDKAVDHNIILSDKSRTSRNSRQKITDKRNVKDKNDNHITSQLTTDSEKDIFDMESEDEEQERDVQSPSPSGKELQTANHSHRTDEGEEMDEDDTPVIAANRKPRVKRKLIESDLDSSVETSVSVRTKITPKRRKKANAENRHELESHEIDVSSSQEVGNQSPVTVAQQEASEDEDDGMVIPETQPADLDQMSQSEPDETDVTGPEASLSQSFGNNKDRLPATQSIPEPYHMPTQDVVEAMRNQQDQGSSEIPDIEDVRPRRKNPSSSSSTRGNKKKSRFTSSSEEEASGLQSSRLHQTSLKSWVKTPPANVSATHSKRQVSEVDTEEEEIRKRTPQKSQIASPSSNSPHGEAHMNDRRFLEEQAAKLQAPFLVDYDKLEVLRKKFIKKSNLDQNISPLRQNIVEKAIDKLNKKLSENRNKALSCNAQRKVVEQLDKLRLKEGPYKNNLEEILNGSRTGAEIDETLNIFPDKWPLTASQMHDKELAKTNKRYEKALSETHHLMAMVKAKRQQLLQVQAVLPLVRANEELLDNFQSDTLKAELKRAKLLATRVLKKLQDSTGGSTEFSTSSSTATQQELINILFD